MSEEYGRWVSPSASGGKFWTISLSGSTVTTTFGKLGSTGQSSTKSLPNKAKAVEFVLKTIKEKEKKGYKKHADSKKRDAGEEAEAR